MAKSKSAKEAQRQQEIAAIEHELLLMAMGALGHNRVDPEDGRRDAIAARRRRRTCPRRRSAALRSVPRDEAFLAAVGAALFGGRIGEALALDWEHVDLDRRVVRIRRNWTHGEFGTLKTLRSVRDLPLSEEAAMALKSLHDNPPRGACKSDAVKDTGLPLKAGDDSALLRQPDIDADRKPGDPLDQSAGKKALSALAGNHPPEAAKDNVDPKSAWPRLVFAGRKGQPLDAHNIAARELKPACKMAGIQVIGWHALRHTAITLIQQAGATGIEAQRFAGHASAKQTEGYTHAEVDRLRASVDAVRLVEETKERLM